MKIALSSDHRGDELSRLLEAHLRRAGHAVEVLGPRDGESRDYPDAAALVGEAVSDGGADRGILLCGSGNGVCIAANKVRGIRAALARSAEEAEMSRRHNDANILCLGVDAAHADAFTDIVDAWLEAGFDGGRHARRVDKIAALEQQDSQPIESS